MIDAEDEPFQVSPRLLRVFMVVAERRALRRAAFALRKSPKSVYKDLKSLEELAGTPLLKRDHNGVEPTRAGEVVAADARRLFAGIANTLERARLVARQDDSSLRIGYIGAGSEHIIVPALRVLNDENPPISLHLVEAPSMDLLRGLEIGALDVAICRPLGRPNMRLSYETLYEEDVVVALPADHRLAADPLISVIELDDLCFVGPGPDSDNVPFYDALGFTPGWFADSATQVDSMLLLVSLGRGVCLISHSVAQRCRLSNVVYRRLDTTRTMPLCIVRCTIEGATPSSVAADRFAALLRAEADRYDS